MAQKLRDDAGRSWRIALLPTEPENEAVEEEMILRFTPDREDVEEVEIRVVGPVLEELPDLASEELKMGLEAAQNEVGFLFLDRDDQLWWVRTPEEDPTADGAALSFSHQTDELDHPGPLPSSPTALTEDELQELLDEASGRVLG